MIVLKSRKGGIYRSWRLLESQDLNAADIYSDKVNVVFFKYRSGSDIGSKQSER